MKKLIFLLLLTACLLVGCSTQPSDSSPSLNPIPAIDPEEATLDALLNNMTLEAKVSQMFFVRFPEDDPIGQLQAHQFGGYLLFGKDFKNQTPDTIRQLTTNCQSVSSIPLFIGVDEEGGDVNRISSYPQFRATPFPSPKALMDSGGLSAVQADTQEKCILLKSLGINVNFAPVCDVSENPSDYIYSRTTGRNASETANYIKIVVQCMNANQIGSVLKHFPGYGPNSDTHQDFSRDPRPIDVFESTDFIPFQAGIQEGAGSVLISHNIIECMDASYPASLSGTVHQLLRDELNFDGVIITDDLDMAAINNLYTPEDAVVTAVNAGNDMIITSHYATDIPAVITAVQNGSISESQIDASVRRILKWKIQLGLITTN